MALVYGYIAEQGGRSPSSALARPPQALALRSISG